MKKMILRVLLALWLLVLLAAAGFGVLYAGRLRTVNSIEKITDYSDYNLYRMDVRYDYSIDDVINYGIADNQSMIDVGQDPHRHRAAGYLALPHSGAGYRTGQQPAPSGGG